MSRVGKLGGWVVGCFALALLATNVSLARPQYCKSFLGKYTQVKAAKTAKCLICHEKGKSKEVRNVYGGTLAKLFGAENVKDTAKIEAVLSKGEAAKSAVEGKTFGDLLKEGKLPASKE